VRTLFRHPRGVWYVFSVFVRFFIAPALHLPGSDRRSGPVRTRLAFEQLGGAWIKLGQMLALRFDLLPTAYCDELFKLLNRVAPFSYAGVREIIRSELGGEPETVFRSFSHESFAAASIGQVHQAVLHSGEQVAVKVQRPGIRETLRSDIQLMYAMSWLLDFQPIASWRQRDKNELTFISTCGHTRFINGFLEQPNLCSGYRQLLGIYDSTANDSPIHLSVRNLAI
jgi:predicted unusual protein kinase regulating ubiquinone biosynthesis (AarF/ABC1/UbiB family)